MDASSLLKFPIVYLEDNTQVIDFKFNVPQGHLLEQKYYQNTMTPLAVYKKPDGSNIYTYNTYEKVLLKLVNGQFERLQGNLTTSHSTIPLGELLTYDEDLIVGVNQHEYSTNNQYNIGNMGSKQKTGYFYKNASKDVTITGLWKLIK